MSSEDPELAEAIRLSLIDAQAEGYARDSEDAALQETLRLSMTDSDKPKELKPLPEVEEHYPTDEEYREILSKLHRPEGLVPTCEVIKEMAAVGGQDEGSLRSPGCKRMRSNTLVSDSEGLRFDPREMQFAEMRAEFAEEVWDLFFGPGPVPGEGCTPADIKRWMRQPLSSWWSKEDEPRHSVPFIVQQGGGPCGLLAALEGFLLRYLIFSSGSSGPCEDIESVSSDMRLGALIDAMATMMSRCKASDEANSYVCAIVEPCDDDNEGLARPPRIWTRPVESIGEYQKLLLEHQDPLLASQTAAVSFVVSMILTRGGPTLCRSDMDDPSGGVLVGMFGHCSQELVNLCLLGRCFSNVFDGEESLGGGMMLRGVPADIPITVGYVTELEALRYVTVGSRYKNPEFPLWVVGSPNHYTLLFSRNLNSVKRDPVGVVKDQLKDIFDANSTDEGIATLEQVEKLVTADLPDELIPSGVSRKDIVSRMRENSLDGSIVLFDAFQSVICSALFGREKLEEIDAESDKPSAYTLYLYDGQRPGGPSLCEIKVVTSHVDEQYAVADNNESLQRTIQTRWPNAMVQFSISFNRMSPTPGISAGHFPSDGPYVAVIGGGLAGLTCATYLVKNAIRVTLFEKDDRLGGQCWTRYENNGVIWEAGGEGFVRRAVAVPKLAKSLGIEKDLIPQNPVDNYEIDENYNSIKLERGDAAKKLGFHVKKEDLGQGISSFRLGMGELVNSAREYLEGSSSCSVRFNTSVSSVASSGSMVKLVLDNEDELLFDEVVIATPEKAASIMLGKEPLPAKFLSHVSVHCFISTERNSANADGWHSFSVPAAMQEGLEGLRAAALVNEKFPGRSPPGTSLFRCYYRPRGDHINDWSDEKWSAVAASTLRKVFSIEESIDFSSFYVSRWDSTIPVFDDEYRSAVEDLKDSVDNEPISIIGSAVTGAGIEPAVQSGEDAATNILTRIGRPHSK
ncbi:hypothetical protein FOL47_008398 [Perkinsus chesapeaki]|uniref:Deubiquitinating enzyme MINDY-3/4 conserved domain-containing protein n=1 Tax=Perkinsus chesapeaki TaxID=330153 RepID=A0A7J6LE82_PERCH|nr:hypothetical protein FOL47_008398 [Perkinsus chesapeaki]